VNSTSRTKSRSIGLVSLVCLVIGNMIGSGVYISSTYALGALGDARLVLLAWALGGAHAICGAIAYAALAKRIPMSGGEYSFLSRFVHPSIGFMAGWISLIAGFTAPIATAALVFGNYMSESRTANDTTRWIATGLILTGALFHWIHLKTGSWVNNGIVLLKFIGFAVFAMACIGFLQQPSTGDPEVPFVPALSESIVSFDYLVKLDHAAIWMTILVQLFFISLSYTGFNASIYIAGEIDGRIAGEQTNLEGSNTSKDGNMLVPRSMIIACLLVTAIYLGINYLFLACDSREAILAGGDYFVSDVAYDVGGSTLRWVMRITIALSSATSVLAMLATGPRVYAQMAADGWLPSWLGYQNDVPRGAIGIQAALSIALVWLANILDMISYLGITLTACGALATSTLWIAYQAMSDRRPIAWWEHIALAVYIAGALLLLVAAWFVKPVQLWCCLGTFASGIAVYLVSRGKSNRSLSAI